MLLRRAATAVKEYHFAAYQVLLALIGLTVALCLLCDYKWPVSLGYAAVTIASYGAGQAIVGVVQRGGAAKGRRTLD